MLVSKKEKRKTKEKMKGNAEHSATTTKFLLENVATNHVEKGRQLEQKELRKKKRKGKKEKKRTKKKKTKKQKTWLILPVVICLSQRKKNGKRKKK